MAFKFESTQRDFFSEYRNGPTFAVGNPTLRIQGNVGDLCRLSEIIVVEIVVNEFEAVSMTYDSSGVAGKITSGLNFEQEGLFVGALIDIIQGTNVWPSTVTSVTGFGNTVVLFTKAGVDLEDGPNTNVIIRVKTAPVSVQYKYGLIKDTIAGVTPSNYASPLDGNIQGYYNNAVTALFTDMIRLGSPAKSWDMSQDIKIKFNGSTPDDYFHTFEIQHDFRLPFWREEEIDNLTALVNPNELLGVNTYKYANGYFLGNTASLFGKFEQLGAVGNVGYFNENYNGFENIFNLSAFAISNSLSTGKLEATVVNTVTGTITASVPAFNAPQQLIVGHALLATSETYSDSSDIFNNVFLIDTLSQDSGAGAVASSIIKAFTVTFTDSQNIDFSFTVEFSVVQKSQISAILNSLLWFTIGDETLSENEENQVNLRVTDLYSFNTDVTGLITVPQPDLYDSFSAYSGPRKFSDRKLWDADFLPYKWQFRLTQFADGSFTQISSINSKLVMENGSGGKFTLFSKPLPVAISGFVESGGFIYTILNNTVIDNPKFPSTDAINITNVISNPPFAGAFQVIRIQSSLPRITWRDWIANSDIPAEFFDESEANDGLNNLTSIKQTGPWFPILELEVIVTKFVPGDGFFALEGIGTFEVESITTYNLQSDHLDVAALNVDPGAIWSGSPKIFDLLGSEITKIETNSTDTIKAIGDHSLGLLPVGDLWGEIFIIKDGDLGTVWALHSDRDWTNENNPLLPTDTLATGNTQFVEVVSEVDKVTLICQTSIINIQLGPEYWIYARIGKKT